MRSLVLSEESRTERLIDRFRFEEQQRVEGAVRGGNPSASAGDVLFDGSVSIFGGGVGPVTSSHQADRDVTSFALKLFLGSLLPTSFPLLRGAPIGDKDATGDKTRAIVHLAAIVEKWALLTHSSN